MGRVRSKRRARPWAVVRMGDWPVHFAATKRAADRYAAKMNAGADAQERAWSLLNARPAYSVELRP